MSLHYYSRLTNGDVTEAQKLKENSFTALTPFFQYLDTAIRSLKARGEIKVTWSLLGIEKLQLVPQEKIYRFEFQTTIKLKRNFGRFLVKNFPNEYDCSEELRSKKLKQKFRITQVQIHQEKNKVYLEIPELEFPPNEKELVLDWGFEEIIIYNNHFHLQEIKEIIYKDESLEFEKQEDKILLYSHLEEIKGNLKIDGKLVFFEVIEQNSLRKDLKVLKTTKDYAIVVSSEKISHPDYTEITLEDLAEDYKIDLEKIFYKDGKKKFEYQVIEDSKKLIFNVKNVKEIENKLFTYENIFSFKGKLIPPQPQDEFKILLQEPEEYTNDDPYTKSPTEYFFDPDVEVKTELKNLDRYSIAYKNPDEKIISLRKQGKDVLPPPESKYLKVVVNTYQLDRQKEAIFYLQDKPVSSQRNLLKLFEPRNTVRWENENTDAEISSWFVLQHNTPGSEEQRAFIKKALKTKDFCILEGPPGSGKTTVILELICQLISSGKKILLCGSTHVAIDNVLERLKEKGLITALSILPIRVGQENVISDEITEFSLENQLQAQNISQELLLDAANLVCGTTIGILQYPRFKEKRESLAPIVPEFDYLIIDESSKTTFPEFLVPALYAKKWILVGDIHQLSPFVDRDQLVSNLRELHLEYDKNTRKERILDPKLQEACFQLFLCKQLISSDKPPHIAFVVESFDYLQKEISERKRNFPNEDILQKIKFIDNPDNPTSSILLEACEAQVVFIKRKDIEFVLEFLPESFFVFGYPDWTNSSHYFRHRRIYKREKYFFSTKFNKKELEDVDKLYTEVEQYLKEKNWAEEIAWRLIRDFELRDKEKDFGFRKDLEYLYPVSEKNFISRLYTIRNISLPSVLEGIQKGIKGRLKNWNPTTISEGFTEVELVSRYERLVYQYRMHENIASYPKKAFYSDKALQTHPTTNEKRTWSYKEYSSSNVWLNVKGHTLGNKNFKEAEVMLKELDKFVRWCEHQKHPDPLDKDGKWKIACLTFYKGQERLIREKLQSYCNQPQKQSQFSKQNVKIFLYTVDKFQGQEADIVFLSMVQTKRDGFLDSPNRLNVAITRARFQLVILGYYEYFSKSSRSDELRNLAKEYEIKRVDVK